MILAIGHIKGGVGKTMLAVNLAVSLSNSGHDVLLVDGDEQRTALTFTELRNELLGKAGYTAVSLYGAALRIQVRRLETKYSDILIDVGGRDSGSLRAALLVADAVLIPVQPRSFDIWAVEQMMELVKEARELNSFLVGLSIINAADAQGKDNADAADVLKSVDGINLMPFMIGRRKAFPNAAAAGKGVSEYVPRDAKAVQEMEILAHTLFMP